MKDTFHKRTDNPIRWRVLSNPFTDVKEGSYFFCPVLWAADNGYAKGITKGTSAFTFSPNKTCTSGQIVTFIYRLPDGLRDLG